MQFIPELQSTLYTVHCDVTSAGLFKRLAKKKGHFNECFIVVAIVLVKSSG